MRIHRNGKELGRPDECLDKDKERRKANMEPRQVVNIDISSLIPLESSVTKTQTKELIKILKNGCKFHKNPRVVKFNDKYLVVDGCHRIKAYVEEGATQVDVDVQESSHLTSELQVLYQNAYKAREVDGITFENIPFVTDEEARKLKTLSEFEENDTNWIFNLPNT